MINTVSHQPLSQQFVLRLTIAALVIISIMAGYYQVGWEQEKKANEAVTQKEQQ